MRTNEEREQTLNQLLTEMDGFTPDSGVVFVAATNRADLLDAALMRAGRFDRKIRILRPDEQGRREVLQVRAGWGVGEGCGAWQGGNRQPAVLGGGAAGWRLLPCRDKGCCCLRPNCALH